MHLSSGARRHLAAFTARSEHGSTPRSPQLRRPVPGGTRVAWIRHLLSVALLGAAWSGENALAAKPSDSLGPVALNDDGGWSWFEDERAIVAGDKLFVGSVATGRFDPSRKGDIDAMSVDLSTGAVTRFPLRKNLEADDHNSPAWIELPDGRLLAMYSKHGPENRIYFRISRKRHDAASWGQERVFVPSDTSRVTYSNLHWLDRSGGKGRMVDFFRGLDDRYKPSWAYSEDLGSTWTAGGLLVDVESPTRHRPYVKYASDGKGLIHFVFSEGHPRDFDNSLHHAYLRKGTLHRSDGTPIRALEAGPVLPGEATRIFAGNPTNVAWPHDIALDSAGVVRVAYSVRRDAVGEDPAAAATKGRDLRYRFARWDGRAWSDHEIAFAGSRLYAGEDDYAGGICLHPDDPDVVFISSNVDPATGVALTMGHYELFRGRTPDRGGHWTWEPLTPGSSNDNLRPIAPRWRSGRTVLLWLRGKYRTYTDYDLEVMVWVEKRK
jgi:hypothetical protein